jgi:hypothetical protein
MPHGVILPEALGKRHCADAFCLFAEYTAGVYWTWFYGAHWTLVGQTVSLPDTTQQCGFPVGRLTVYPTSLSRTFPANKEIRL